MPEVIFRGRDVPNLQRKINFMWEKPRKYVDEKVIQPVKNAMAVAIAALLLGIVAIIVAVAK